MHENLLEIPVDRIPSFFNLFTCHGHLSGNKYLSRVGLFSPEARNLSGFGASLPQEANEISPFAATLSSLAVSLDFRIGEYSN